MFGPRTRRAEEPTPLAYQCPDGTKNQYLQDLLKDLTPADLKKFEEIAAGTRSMILDILWGPDNLRHAVAHAFGERTGPYPMVVREPDDLEQAA